MPVPQSNYEPKVGDIITVLLPDERTRATIEKLISNTAAIVQLNHFVTATKSHNYRKGDLVPVRYGTQDMGLPGWTAVSDKELAAATLPEPLAEEDAEAAVGEAIEIPAPEISTIAVPPPGMTYEDL